MQTITKHGIQVQRPLRRNQMDLLNFRNWPGADRSWTAGKASTTGLRAPCLRER
jgi:hypothetical protein